MLGLPRRSKLTLEPVSQSVNSGAPGSGSNSAGPGSCSSDTTPKLYSTLSPEEINKRYEAIKQNSGILTFGGQRYENVGQDDLPIMSDLGQGTCGCVFKSRYKGRSVAVKRMKRTDNEIESKRIFMDLDVLKKCNDCQYIVKGYGYIITFEYLFIVMEVMATCFEKLLKERGRPGIPEAIIGQVALSVVRAMDYLKDTHQIMHRDVKPSNILLDLHGNVKLCDFGISGKLIDSKAQTMSTYGCTAYLAPERIQTLDGITPGGSVIPLATMDDTKYDIRADVWSLGISLVQLATGRSPFPEDCAAFEMMIRIKNSESPAIRPEDGFSPEFCSFVNDCLQKDVSQRPRFKELLAKPFLVRAVQQPVDVALWFTNPEQYEQQIHGHN